MAGTDSARPAASLRDLLADVLPKDVAFTFHHYSTPPARSAAIYNAPPHRKPERTYCESHLLAASIAPKDAQAGQDSADILALAIEVLIYSTKRLTTIFVSKADSTGYISELNLPRSQASPLKAICGTFVSWLARERQRAGTKLVVSLFARAQDQYLFPASIDNPNKHVLDDRGLVKWWCRVLDPIISEYAVEESKPSLADRLEQTRDGPSPTEESPIPKPSTAKGYLVIPGFDPYDMLRYTPAPPQGCPRRWATSHPLLQLAPYPAAPPRCLVPHFPDDPKSRFLDELDEELPDARTDSMSQQGGTPSRSSGQWRSVRSVEQFWEMMAFRQECSSGRIVGFIWVVISPPPSSIPEEDQSESQQSQSYSQNDSQTSLPSILSSPKAKQTSRKPRRRKTNTRSGPIPLLLPKISSGTSNLSSSSTGPKTASARLPQESSPYYKWPATSRGTVLLSHTAYDQAHEILLQQNFSTRAAAARSTQRWTDEVAVLTGMEKWGWTVVGKKEAAAHCSNSTSGTSGAAPVNMVGVRKRKPENCDADSSRDSVDSGVHIINADSVRKKPKVEGASAPATSNGINTLGAGLVRKKPKA